MVCLAHVDFIIIFVFLVKLASSKQCDSSTVVNGQCSDTEICMPAKDPKNGYCSCFPGYTRVNNTHCENITKPDMQPAPKMSSLVDKNDDEGNGHVVAGVLIPIFLFMIVICGVYFSRKYHVVSYVRNKLYQRSNNYDEVMIGQDIDDDDPPLR